jgi:hypothetical protein
MESVSGIPRQGRRLMGIDSKIASCIMGIKVICHKKQSLQVHFHHFSFYMLYCLIVISFFCRELGTTAPETSRFRAVWAGTLIQP